MLRWGRWRSRRGLLFLAALLAASPIYFAPLGDWMAADPLPGQAWMRHNLILASSLAVLALAGGVFAADRIRPAVALRRPAIARTYRNTEPKLADLRAEMQRLWIDGVLARSLERIVPIELNFAERAHALASPLRSVTGRALPAGATIGQLFETTGVGRRMLVIGQPGAGKTTQLLHLAETLLAACDESTVAPVPVILPLSAGRWPDDPRVRPETDHDRRSLEEARAEQVLLRALDWMAGEIAARYYVPRKQAFSWLIAANSPLVLMLDGLDEVREEDRANCAALLGRLRSEYSFGMVVSCRTTEYFELGRRLPFGLAVEILPLTPAGVDAYLIAAGPELQSLRQYCRRDRSLARLFQNPLTLAIGVLTYRGRSPDAGLLQGTPQQRLDYLWSQYIEAMLYRQRDTTELGAGDRRFPPKKAHRWLMTLATGMTQAGRSEFRPEMIDLGWLPAQLRRLLLAAIAVTWVALTGFGLVYATTTIAVRYGTGLAVFFDVVAAAALVIYLVVRFGTADLALRWRFEPFRIVRGVWYGFLAGIGLGVAIGIWAGPAGIAAGIIPCTLLGLVIGVAASAVPEPGGREDDGDKPGARSAAWQTLKVQLGVAAVLAAIPILTQIVTLLFISSSDFAQRAVLLSTGPSIGAVWAAVTTNMSPWLANRLAGFWAVVFGLLPRRLSRFLRHADERIIMRPAGTSYQFLHLTLQEHLAHGPRLRHRPPVTPSRPPAGSPVSDRTTTAGRPNRASADGPSTVELYTGVTGRIVALAEDEALAFAHPRVGSEHLLLGILHEDGASADALVALGASLPAVRQALEDLKGYGRQAPPGPPPLTPRAKKVLRAAEPEAVLLDDADIGPDHILLALLREGDGIAVQVLRTLGLDATRVRDEVMFVRRATAHRPDDTPA
ncbi:NACHT domain-containing protein [Dactylosporangium matsuzakiense]|uniref:Clp R domain-containing protein n=1 Tax=Dactylosporangium matsuzakiense TaxID=53360 RepID=A0A9W6NRE1_9ACTN|nr:Clp protease N-terminal domain-containing protein [Dactylosporangium matsuzakiense]UWZ43892.1 NACHT domain-containing protein [Dactylosporangium matsuzakiense]GLL06313.1 hypothetical protein GCM10017581_080620 [Dactylosporangium matsuzakiense]